MADQSEESADLLAKLKALPIAERSQEFLDLLAELEALPADRMALATASRLNSRLSPILGHLQLMAIGAFGPLPEPAMEAVATLLRTVREARDLYHVLIDGIHLVTPVPPDHPAEDKERPQSNSEP
jgi:hypothetical protein